MPTVARSSLAATLESIWLDTYYGDVAVMVLADSLGSPARKVFEEYAGEGWSYDEYDRLGCFGHPVSNAALDSLQRIGNRWVARMDDDDCYLIGAIPTMLEHLEPVPVIYRARWGPGHPAAGVELPHMHEVRYGNIATPMVVAPVCNARYGMRMEGDFDYAEALVAELGEPIWRDELICLVRPE